MNILEPTHIENSERLINQLRLRVYIMVGIPLIIFVLVYLNYLKEDIAFGLLDIELGLATKLLVSIAILGILVIAYLNFFKELRKARSEDLLKDRLLCYYRASMKKYLTFEIGVLVSILGLFITGDKVFSGIYIVCLFLFSLNNPSIYKVFKELKLNKDERKQVIENKVFDDI